MTRLTARNLYDLQLKAADYEAMMDRFQLRKVSKNNMDAGKLKHAVIDTVYGSKYRTSKWHVRLAKLLTRRKTWRHVWKTVTSPIAPGSWACTLHGLVMFVVSQFELFYLPFVLSFYSNGSVGTVCVGLVLQVLHLVDLVLNLNTAFMHRNKLVTSRNEIVRDHMTKWFALEVVSAVPMGVVYFAADKCWHQVPCALVYYDEVLITLRLLRCLFAEHFMVPKRLYRDNKHLISWILYSRYAHLLEIAKLIWLVLLVAHCMGCIWHMIAVQPFTVSVGERYVMSFYYAVQLIQGQGGANGTWRENLFSTFVILVGSVILAVVFGNVAMLVSNFNANTTSYRHKMESVFATMEKMALPQKLQERVHQYYTHVWTEYRSLDGDIVKFQRELAHTLGLEVGLYKYMNLVTKIQFWESCSPDFTTQIVLNLAIRVYLPDDYVVRKGDTGDEMFMINRGICELSDAEKSQEPKNVAILPSTASVIGSEMMSMADDDLNNSPEGSEDEGKSGEIKQPSISKTDAKLVFRRRSQQEKRKQILPQKSNYDLNLDEKQPKKESKKEMFLYPGQAFGEMSLLLNYKRTANVRAATYVEICVLSRATFQRIISRYPEDRRHVLTVMLKNCIEKKAIPFPWDDVVDAVAERRRNHGTQGSSRFNVEATVTSTEAAQALVDRIDVNRPDESIKYGFQTFHSDLANTSSRAATEETPIRVSINSKLRRKSVANARSLHTNDEELQPSTTENLTSAQPIADSRIDNLEKTLGVMMNVMNSMVASIERLENLVQNQSRVSCQCSLTANLGSRTASVRPKEDDEGEARGADLTNLPSPRRMKMRRRTESSNLASERISPRETEAAVMHPSREWLPDKALKPKQNMRASRLAVSVSTNPLMLSTGVIESLPMDQPTDVPRTEVLNPFKPMIHRPGWLQRSRSTAKEPTLADQLYLQQNIKKDKRTGDFGKAATVGKLTVQSSQLRTRSSFPTTFDGSSPLDGSKADHRQRRGSRVNIDAFATLTSYDFASPEGLTPSRPHWQSSNLQSAPPEHDSGLSVDC